MSFTALGLQLPAWVVWHFPWARNEPPKNRDVPRILAVLKRDYNGGTRISTKDCEYKGGTIKVIMKQFALS